LTRALRLAGNQAARAMQRESVEQVQRHKYVRGSDLEKRLPLDMPRRSDELEHLVWTERISGKDFPMSRFPTAKGIGGVFAAINRSSKGRQLLRGAFVARMESGHVGVFKREGTKRLPIRELFTVGLAGVFTSTAESSSVAVNAALSAARNRMTSAFERGLRRELQKLRVKGDL
jgi:hypothetical protein